MTDLRKLSEAAKSARRAYETALTTPNGPWALLKIRQSAAVSGYHNALEAEHRSGSLIHRTEYERVLALLAEARESMARTMSLLSGPGYILREAQAIESLGAGPIPELRATLSRIDDALAAEREARG